MVVVESVAVAVAVATVANNIAVAVALAVVVENTVADSKELIVSARWLCFVVAVENIVVCIAAGVAESVAVAVGTVGNWVVAVALAVAAGNTVADSKELIVEARLTTWRKIVHPCPPRAPSILLSRQWSS